MSRVIKFRAINAKGEFIYGLPYTDSENETAYYDEYNNRMCWRNEDGAHCNMPYKNGTLEQFTGLKDCNGVEIYEGDILALASDNTVKCVVSWDNRRARYTEWWPRESFEVIGNIHETPELLS